jgi:uncharacterized protein
MSDELNLSITGVEPQIEIAGARRTILATTRGKIRMVLHGREKAERAALCIGGASGGLDGPAALYPRLGLALPAKGLSVLRLSYRIPGEMTECILDTMAGMSFLKGVGHQRIALIGHSFGGGVAIATAALNAGAAAVVAISSQLHGAENVARIAPRPLLLVHGGADPILSAESSKLIFERAGDPKTLKVFDGADHGLTQAGDAVFNLVEQWLLEKI